MQKISRIFIIIATFCMLALVSCTKGNDTSNKLVISFDNNTYEIVKGEQVQLIPSITNGEVEYEDLVWTVANEKIATCVNGIVTGVSKGKTVVSVTCKQDPDACTFVTIKVTEENYFPIVSFGTLKAQMELGETQMLTTQVQGFDFDYELTYQSLNENVATVTNYGLITAVGKGASIISVIVSETDNPSNATEYCFVIVVNEESWVINYILHGGKNDPRNITRYTESLCPVNIYDATRDYYEFLGWFNGVDREGPDGVIKAPLIEEINKGFKDNLNLHANWKPIDYDITYNLDLDGAENDPSNPNTYNIESFDIELAAPIRKGYKFLGWFDEDDNQVTVIPQGSHGDITLKAKWEIIEYSIKLNNVLNTSPLEYADIDTFALTLLADLNNFTDTDVTKDDFYSTSDTAIKLALANNEILEKYNWFFEFMLEEVSENANNYNQLTNTIAVQTLELLSKLISYDTTAINGSYTDGINVIKHFIHNLINKDHSIQSGDTTYLVYTTDFSIAENRDRFEENLTVKYTYTVLDEPFTLPIATREDYKFLGWFEDGDFETSPITTIDPLDCMDFEFDANWRYVYHNINYNLNNGTFLKTYTISEDATVDQELTIKTYNYYNETTKAPTLSKYALLDVAKYITLRATTLENVYQIVEIVDSKAAITKEFDFVVMYESSATDTSIIPTLEYITTSYKTDFINGCVVIDNLPLTASSADCEIKIKAYTNNNQKVTVSPEPTTIFKEDVGLSTLETPNRIGYTFEGWYLEDTFTTLVTSIDPTTITDVTLYAKWETIEYTITIIDGDNNVQSKYTIESEPIIITEPTKAGYKCLGLFDSGETVSYSEIKKGSYGDITLNVKWELITYNIEFDAKGGTSVTSLTYNVEFTENVDISTIESSKTGYTFKGWYENESGTGEKVTSIAPSECRNITLYAKWELITYDINYDLDGGTNSTLNPTTYTVESDTITFKAPKKTGYRFLGWYSDTTKVEEITLGSTGDVNVKAKWEIITYTISYLNSSNATNPESNLSSYTVDTASFDLADATKNGYDFKGWYSSADFTDDTKVTRVETSACKNITLYAYFQLKEYSISYVLNSGTNPSDVLTSYNVEDDDYTLPTPTREAYRFYGWYESNSFAGDALETIDTSTCKDYTLYAKWMKEDYKISYNLNGGRMYQDTSKYAFNYNRDTMVSAFLDDACAWGNTTKRPVEVVPNSAGNSFWNVFWGTNATKLGIIGFFKNETYSAKWGWLYDYLITSAKQLGKTLAENDDEDFVWTTSAFLWPGSYSYGSHWILNYTSIKDEYVELTAPGIITSYNLDSSSITLLTPYKVNCTFEGWYDNAEFTGSPITTLATAGVEYKDYTLYAKWTAN